MLSLLSTGHSMTAYNKIKQQLLLQLPLKRHIDLVRVEFPMEELATVSKDSSKVEGSNQVKNVQVTETKVPGLSVNIATYSPRPGILISTIP